MDILPRISSSKVVISSHLVLNLQNNRSNKVMSLSGFGRTIYNMDLCRLFPKHASSKPPPNPAQERTRRSGQGHPHNKHSSPFPTLTLRPFPQTKPHHCSCNATVRRAVISGSVSRSGRQWTPDCCVLALWRGRARCASPSARRLHHCIRISRVSIQ